MFVYSIPILFTNMQFGTPVEFFGVSCFLLILIYIVTPAGKEFKEINWGKVSELSFYGYLFDSWNGMVKLWLVFWPFFIILNLSLFSIDSFAKSAMLTVSGWDEVHFILVMPTIFWVIIVWRNSQHTCSRYWAVAARFMTVSVFFEYILKLAIRRDYPRIFFECQDIALDYAACF